MFETRQIVRRLTQILNLCHLILHSNSVINISKDIVIPKLKNTTTVQKLMRKSKSTAKEKSPQTHNTNVPHNTKGLRNKHQKRMYFAARLSDRKQHRPQNDIVLNVSLWAFSLSRLTLAKSGKVLL